MSTQGQCGKGDERCKDSQDYQMLLSGADSSEGAKLYRQQCEMGHAQKLAFECLET